MNVAIPGYKANHKPALFLAAVAVTALGIGAAVGVWQLTDPGSKAANAEFSSQRTSYPFTRADTRSLSLYLVDSQEQENMVLAGEQEAARERATAGMADPNETVLILKVTTPDEEGMVSEVLDAWSANSSGVRLFDLRGREPISIAPGAPQIEAVTPLTESFSPCTAPGVDDYYRLLLASFDYC